MFCPRIASAEFWILFIATISAMRLALHCCPPCHRCGEKAISPAPQYGIGIAGQSTFVVVSAKKGSAPATKGSLLLARISAGHNAELSSAQ